MVVFEHRLDWLCDKIELSVRHKIGEIETENARFHAIIQVDISIRSFDQSALSVYFFCVNYNKKRLD